MPSKKAKKDKAVKKEPVALVASMLVGMRKKVEITCEDCGAKFVAIKIARFCSDCNTNARRCKAYRERKAGKS